MVLKMLTAPKIVGTRKIKAATTYQIALGPGPVTAGVDLATAGGEGSCPAGF